MSAWSDGAVLPLLGGRSVAGATFSFGTSDTTGAASTGCSLGGVAWAQGCAASERQERHAQSRTPTAPIVPRAVLSDESSPFPTSRRLRPLEGQAPPPENDPLTTLAANTGLGLRQFQAHSVPRCREFARRGAASPPASGAANTSPPVALALVSPMWARTRRSPMQRPEDERTAPDRFHGARAATRCAARGSRAGTSPRSARVMPAVEARAWHQPPRRPGVPTARRSPR